MNLLKEGDAMKLLIEFSLKKGEIQKDYRRIFIHLFKTALSEANEGKYYNDYYAVGKSKNYTFSVNFKDPKFEGDVIQLGSKQGRLYFSTSEQKTGFIFYAALMAQRKKPLPLANDNSLRILSVKQLRESKVSNNSILVKMTSPLCVRSHDREKDFDYYYSTAHSEFEKESKRVVEYQLLQEGFPKSIAESVKITPVDTKKVIVQFYESKIEASLGYFMLDGDPIALNYLLQAGIGSRRSCGFGTAILQAEA